MKITQFYKHQTIQHMKRTIMYSIGALFIVHTLVSCSSQIEEEVPETTKKPTTPAIVEQNGKKAPLEYTIATEVEALHASSMLSPASQGISSYNDYDIPLSRSISYLKRKKANELALNLPSLKVTWGELLSTAEELKQLLPQLDANPHLLAERFIWYKPIPTILYTGYYEPVLKASRKRTEQYKYPIYATPADMKALQLGQFHPSLSGQRIIYRMANGIPVPYHSRKDIDSNKVLQNKGLEIAFTDNPVDIFFVQIQGSGRLHFTDGTQSYLLYASQTGKEYVSLGRVMQEKGHLEAGNVNMFTIREWLVNNPQKVQELLNSNPSYVFFREAKDGLVGSIAQKITPWQTIAVDRKTVPYGSVGVVDIALRERITNVPANTERTRSITGLVFAQDTGGAIRGNRIDLFCGPGDSATQVAGLLAGRNPFWLLLQKKRQ